MLLLTYYTNAEGDIYLFPSLTLFLSPALAMLRKETL